MMKIKNLIYIPFELDIKEFYENQESNTNDYYYELASICFHAGDGVNAGHYTSNEKN